MSESERDAWNAGFAEAVRRHYAGTLEESRDPGNPLAPGRSHESECDCARRCHHLPDEVCERCSDD